VSGRKTTPGGNTKIMPVSSHPGNDHPNLSGALRLRRCAR
jgi:hypothetical protein